jgi:hypothetical protein
LTKKIGGLEAQITATDKDLEDLDRAMALANDEGAPYIRMVAARVRERLQEYELANVRARNGTQPNCFSTLDAEALEAKLRAFVGASDNLAGVGRAAE